MQNTPAAGSQISLLVENPKVSVVPGGSLSMPVGLVNHGSEVDYLELSIAGIPGSWISAPPPVVRLAPGEKRIVSFTIAPPAPPHGRLGLYPFSIRATSQQNLGPEAVLEGELTVAALQVPGRVSLLLESSQFSVSPGNEVDIKVILINQGAVEDYLSLTVDGIPAGWITTPSPLNRLRPNDQREVILTIMPPRTPQTRAGRHSFKIQIHSREAPGKITEAPCTLTVGAFSGFSSDMTPQRLSSGQTGMISISNDGNVRQAYAISFDSPDGDLVVRTHQPDQLSIAAGETAMIRFSAAPRRFSWIGGENSFAFTAQVSALNEETDTHNGELITRGIVPVWLLPLTLLIGLIIVCVAVIYWYWGFSGDPGARGATQTAAVVQTAAATQTLNAVMTANALVDEEDSDNDGLINREEKQYGTDPLRPDSDADGLLDGEEVRTYGTDPLKPDMDEDGLNDDQEVRIYRTDPRIADTDSDELLDGQEVLLYNTDPFVADMDGDSLTDGEEILRRQTDPKNPDTDNDFSNDGQEVQIGTNPLKPDTDGDRLNDGQESIPCPHPLIPDTDGDGLVDGADLDPCDIGNPAMTATAVAINPDLQTTPAATNAAGTPAPTSAPQAGATLIPTDQPQPPVGGLVVFVSNRDGNYDIYSSNTIGAANRVTADPHNDTQPALSPDGTRIAFTSNRDGNNEVYLMSVSGGDLVNLTQNPNDDQDPTWSPDGKWIAFTSNRDGNQEIYKVRVDGTELQNLSANSANDYQPSWFTDKGLFVATGEWIAFTSDRDVNQEIYLMNKNGSDQRNLTKNPANDFAPAGIPGGDQIAFTSDRDGHQEIYLVDVDGNLYGSLTRNPAQDFNPGWSSDGSWIVFVSDRDGNMEIYLLKRDGSNALVNFSAHSAEDNYPTWK
ncbi:hypothetical protein ACFLZW_01285 [Chloroflexota bacterium]